MVNALKSFRRSEKGRKVTGLYGTVERPTGQSKYFSMESLHRTIDYDYNVFKDFFDVDHL